VPALILNHCLTTKKLKSIKVRHSKPKVTLSSKSHKEQLIEANDFFNDDRLTSLSFAEKDNPYADKDGLVEFIIGTELVADPVITAELNRQKKILISIISVVTNYINRYAEKYGQGYKTDAELWALAMSKIPLMGPSKLDTQSYSRKIRGLDIAADFVNFIMDIVTKEGSALDSFKKFLNKQGDALRFGVEKNEDYYKTITIGVSVEVFKVGQELIYVPKIKQYRVNFDRQNTKWSSACASGEKVDINFSYIYGANVFDYEALEDPDVKEAFDKFIQGSQKAQIEDATTFFNGEFPADDAFA
jgi:hypothetical protein